MSSRTGMRQQIERQKVMEEEKSRNNNAPKNSNENFSNSYKSLNDSLQYGENYLPSLSQSISCLNQNFEYCDSFNNISYNQDPSHNYIEPDEFILNANDFNGQIRNIESPFIISPGYSFEKYNVQPYNTDYMIDSNKLEPTKFPYQYHDISNNNLPLPHDIGKPEFSLSCPVTGEQSDISINHALSSCNFVQTPNSSVQGQYTNEDRRNNLKDRSKKESHNRIERKRRDFINQQITELSYLIPPQMITDGESKKNKGNILKNSVDYISYLQNEMNNTPNYIKETDLAFILIESYRRRNQELEYQIQNYTSQNVVSSVDLQNLTVTYNNYLMLHDQNLRISQSNGKFSNSRNAKPKTPDTNRRLATSATSKQRLSPSDNNNIAFKIEPSSAHSSIGNNSLSTTYRIEEETDLAFKSVEDTHSPRNNYQNIINNHPSLPSIRGDAFFSSNTRYRCMDNHKCESMEC